MIDFSVMDGKTFLILPDILLRNDPTKLGRRSIMCFHEHDVVALQRITLLAFIANERVNVGVYRIAE